jgi:hypothetical protein
MAGLSSFQEAGNPPEIKPIAKIFNESNSLTTFLRWRLAIAVYQCSQERAGRKNMSFRLA